MRQKVPAHHATSLVLDIVGTAPGLNTTPCAAVLWVYLSPRRTSLLQALLFEMCVCVVARPHHTSINGSGLEDSGDRRLGVTLNTSLFNGLHRVNHRVQPTQALVQPKRMLVAVVNRFHGPICAGEMGVLGSCGADTGVLARRSQQYPWVPGLQICVQQSSVCALCSTAFLPKQKRLHGLRKE